MRTVIALAAFVVATGVARAQNAEDGWAPPPGTDRRPTSGEASFLSGRTLGTGEVFVAAALGWPGIWAHGELAPDSTINLGIRGGVVYGSPVMGLIEGVGGEVSVPVRIHVFGEGDVDLAVRVAPIAALGEGRLFGEQRSFRASRLGASSRVDLGVLLGWRIAERVTLLAGAHAGAGLSWVDGAPVRPIGVFTGAIGIEALMSRDTMLFAEVDGGGGVTESPAGVPYYPAREILRIALGLGYLL